MNEMKQKVLFQNLLIESINQQIINTRENRPRRYNNKEERQQARENRKLEKQKIIEHNEKIKEENKKIIEENKKIEEENEKIKNARMINELIELSSINPNIIDSIFNYINNDDSINFTLEEKTEIIKRYYNIEKERKKELKKKLELKEKESVNKFAFLDRAQEYINYLIEFELWTEQLLSLYEYKITEEIKRLTYQTAYQTLYMLHTGKFDKATNKINDNIKSISQITNSLNLEEQINKQFDMLEQQIAMIDPLIASIPGATTGGSANFMFTLKNPKPVQSFDSDLNNNINNKALDKILKPFAFNKEQLMLSKYEQIINASYINIKPIFNILSAQNLALIPKDPLPPFEKLVPWNLPWTAKFLLPSWAPAGGRQYGFPGFPQYPLPV
jgi:hypothetical protein